MKKKIDKSLEPESSLEEEPEPDPLGKDPVEPDPTALQNMNKRLDDMASQYNGFVQTMAKMQQRTDDILQMIIRPPDLDSPTANQTGNGEKKKTDSKSAGITDTWNKKLSDATLHEIVEAGDLALKVHDRRQGLTDLEEFMVGLGKNTLTTYGNAAGAATGRKTV